MTTKSELQDLLRFLAQDAKIPLAVAMSKIKPLQDAKLTSPQAIATNSITKLEPIFKDDPKHPKAVLAAAKRAVSNNKKRPQPSSPSSSSTKRSKLDDPADDLESSLALPSSPLPASSLGAVVLRTNRAPLFLAFAVTCLRYSKPEQPLSSRLSLSQAVVSANSRSKAVSVGLRDRDESARVDGMMAGLRTAKVMGREVGVLRREIAKSRQEEEEEDGGVKVERGSEDELGKEMLAGPQTEQTVRPMEQGRASKPALWGVDLEAMNGTGKHAGDGAVTMSGLPIHTPQSARNYLLKSFATAEAADGVAGGSGQTKGKSFKLVAQEKEENLGKLLKAIEMVCESWTERDEKANFYGLGGDELEKRAWGWYVETRPDIQSGAGGWGEKGVVRLSHVLSLRRIKKEEWEEAAREDLSQASSVTLKEDDAL